MMNLSLKPRTQDLIKEKVASGRYTSADEVIEEAMDLLHARDIQNEEFSEEIMEQVELGLKDLREGRYTTYTSETLHELENDIITRGRKRLEAYLHERQQ